MKFGEKIVLNSSIISVWNFLIDPIKLCKCIPGCKKIVALDERHYEVMLDVKVGPISFSFTVATTILDMRPPVYLSFQSNGKEKAGTFTQKCILTLKAISQQETEVCYDADVVIMGKLSTFGERIFRAKAKQISEEFIGSLKSELLSGLNETATS
jgi:hypothetical protein